MITIVIPAWVFWVSIAASIPGFIKAGDIVVRGYKEFRKGVKDENESERASRNVDGQAGS
jgi:hypothetical protein